MDKFSYDATLPRGLSSCPLFDVLSGCESATIADPNSFRLYGGGLVSASRVADRTSQERKFIHYRVGAASSKQSLAGVLGRDGIEPHRLIHLPIELNETLQTGVRRKMNVNIDYQEVDVAGVICRLAASLAYYTVHGELTTAVMRQGEGIKVRSLEDMDHALPYEGHVFVPQALFIYWPAAFVAMINAVNGEGSVVLTEAVRVDPNTGAAIMPSAGGADLASGCVHALRLLLNMYVASGEGAVASFALAKGIHSVLSVVGHSDEGEYIRDVWRKDYFRRPYGGVYVGDINGFVQFPTMEACRPSTATYIVDTVALLTAACSSLADPCPSMGTESRYPSMFGTGSQAGMEGEERARSNRRVRVEIATASPAYCQNYAKLVGLNTIGSDGGWERVATVLHSLFISASVSPAVNRHIPAGVVSPYYWIEPTSLFKDKDDSSATLAGYGVLPGTKSQITQAAYPRAKVTAESTNRVYVSYEHRSARTVPAYVHMFMNVRGSSANVIPWAFRGDRMACEGRGQADEPRPAGEDASTARDSLATLDQYYWKHGSTAIPSPAEMVYTGRAFGVRISKGEWNDLDMGFTEDNVVLPVDSLGQVEVRWQALQPDFIKVTGERERE